MSEIVNAKGLGCPQPVILTKNALETRDDVTVLVDNATAVENIKRFGASSGCSVEVSAQPGGTFQIHLKKQPGAAAGKPAPAGFSCAVDASPSTGPNVFVIASETMGKGNDELGGLLMKAFIHTALELKQGPDIVILYNAGVKWAVEGSGVLDDLKKLETRGAKLLVCGTCANYFGIKEKIGAGVISNMYDIADTLSKAGRIVMP